MNKSAEQLQQRGRFPKPWLVITASVLLVRAIVWVQPDVRSLLILLGVLALPVTRHRADEKLIVILAALAGFAPILLWIDGAAAVVDPVVIASAVSIGMAICARPSLKRIDPATVLALVPGATAAWYWASTFGTESKTVLTRLLLGWDHFGHFDLFASLRDHSVFKIVQQTLPNAGPLFNERYPAGIHGVWATFWDSGQGGFPDRVNLLQDYATAVVVSFVVCIVVIAYSTLRLINRASNRLYVSMLLVLLVLPIYVFGHFSMAIWGGFPNYSVVIAASALIVSVTRKPIDNQLFHNLVVVSALLVIAYNWYPVALALVGAVWLDVHRQFVKSKQMTRIMLVIFFVFGAILAFVPVVLTFSFGVDHLALDGGFFGPPSNVSVALLLTAVVVVVWTGSSFRTKWILKFVLSPAHLSLLFAILVTVSIRIASGGYPYYQKKIVYALAMIAIIDALAMLIKYFEVRSEDSRLQTTLVSKIVGVAMVIGSTNLIGYWGPDWRVFAPQSTAQGIAMKLVVTEQVARFERPASLLLAIEEEFSSSTSVIKNCLVLADLDTQDYDPILVNYWVGSVLDIVTQEHIVRAQTLAPFLSGSTDPHLNAWGIENTLDIRRDCPIVTRQVRTWLVRINPAWKNRTITINTDLTLTVPKEFSP